MANIRRNISHFADLPNDHFNDKRDEILYRREGRDEGLIYQRRNDIRDHVKDRLELNDHLGLSGLNERDYLRRDDLIGSKDSLEQSEWQRERYPSGQTGSVFERNNLYTENIYGSERKSLAPLDRAVDSGRTKNFSETLRTNSFSETVRNILPDSDQHGMKGYRREATSLERGSDFRQSIPILDLMQNDRLNLEQNSFALKSGSTINPWQVGVGITNDRSLDSGVPTNVASTLALANNILNLFKNQSQPAVPSLLDLPIPAVLPKVNRFNTSVSSERLNSNSQDKRIHSGTDSRYGVSSQRPNRSTGTKHQTIKPFVGFRQPSQVSKKDIKPKAKSSNTSEQKYVKGELKKKSFVPETITLTSYEGINKALLDCNICDKPLRCARSFAEHIMGKMHKDKIEEKVHAYDAEVRRMRSAIKLAESKLVRNTPASKLYHCEMCKADCLSLKTHRNTTAHQKLKKYLHPTCNRCRVNFSSRIEYDEHFLQPSHLKKLDSMDEATKLGSLEISDINIEKKFLERSQEKHIKKHQDQSANSDAKKNTGTKKKTVTEDPNNLVLDYMEDDDLTGVTVEMIPSYNTDRSVGESFLSELRCIHCKLCNKLLDNEETAKIHVRTSRHHRLFTKFIQYKIRNTIRDEKEDVKGTAAGSKRSLPKAESSNAKKPKTSDTPHADEKKEDEEDDVILQNDDTCISVKSSGDDTEMPPNDELEDW